MLIASWLKSLTLRGSLRSSRRSRARRRPHGHVPALQQIEVLEDRCLLSAGALDPTFGNGGSVTNDFSDYIAHVAVNPSDGKIRGLSYDGRELAGFNADGSLDTSFGTQGIATTGFDGPGNMTIDASGRVVVVGMGGNSGIDICVSRLLPDGSPDPSFGSGGQVTISSSFVMADYYFSDGIGGGQWESNVTIASHFLGGIYNNVGIDSHGRIIVAGITRYRGQNISDLITVARFNADGSLDTSFGSGGKLVTSFLSKLLPTNLDFARTTIGRQDLQMVIDGNDRIILADEYSQSDSYDITLSDGSTYTVTHDGGAFNGIALARFNTDGTPDDTFGDRGKVLTDSFGATADEAVGLAIDSSGNLVVSGGSVMPNGVTNPEVFDVARHNASDGSLDTSFGDGGQVVTDFGFDANAVGFEVLGTTLDSSDRIVAAGWTWDAGVDDSHLLLARLLADGSLDSSFGTGGKVTTVLTDNDGLYAAAIDGSGRIIGGGWSGLDPYPSLVARFFSESNTTSLPAGDNGPALTLAAPSDTSLTDVAAVPNPSPADAPAGVQFPLGSFTFNVVGVASGGATTVTLDYPADVTVDTYYQYGPTPDNATPHWYEFLYDGTTGAVIDDVNHIITLFFVDGQRGDHDLTANGVIVDPGSPALRPTEVTIEVRPVLNLNSQGTVDVTIVSTDTFDAATVDPNTVVFAYALPVSSLLKDVDGDGRLDLVLTYNVQDTNLGAIYDQLLLDDLNGDGVLDSSRQEASVSVVGTTADGTDFIGSDTVNLFLSGKSLRDLLDELFS